METFNLSFEKNKQQYGTRFTCTEVGVMVSKKYRFEKIGVLWEPDLESSLSTKRNHFYRFRLFAKIGHFI